MNIGRSRPWPTGPRTIFFGDVASRPTLAKARAAGEITRLSVGVWTADTVSPPEAIIAERIWQIVAHACPDAVVVDRSAARNGRVDDGVVTIATDERTTPLELPGITVLVRPLARHQGDTPWSHGLKGSTPARTLVDNLELSRGRRGRPGRTLTRPELQDWLAEKWISWGPERAGRLREDARAVARELGSSRTEELESLFDEVAGKAPLREGSGALARALRAGTAWDERRLTMFHQIARWLSEAELAAFEAPVDDGELPFFEAYFSNYIEGTEFSVADAREIVETQTPPARRSADGHDILGTHRCVVDPIGRARTSVRPDELVELLRTRHATLMVGRPDIGPGDFELDSNRVGGVTFVEPDLVHGTLTRGLIPMADLEPGLARAIYVMVVVTEVHPFTDGNGRAARLMMNAELSVAGQCRLVVPTVLRNEYVAGLRRASNSGGNVEALTAVLVHAWRWTAAMPWTDRAATDALLEATHALIDSTEAEREGLHLQLP